MASSPDVIPVVNPKKRSRAGKSAGRDDEEAKKARGRPRVEGCDETAADRRRTQIRLAQRAYRQRKETTISSLKRQVHLLQSTIEDMNKAFLNFNDRAVTSGALSTQPDLAYQLRMTTEQFLALAKDAPSGSDTEGDESNELGPQSPLATKRKASQTESMDHQQTCARKRSLGHAQAIDWVGKQTPMREELSAFPRSFVQLPGSDGSSGLSLDPPELQLGTDGLSGQSTSSTGTIEFADIYGRFSTSGTGHTSSPRSAETLSNSDTQFMFPNSRPQLPDPRSSNVLDTPWTYSFQETSFARRLHRASLERAFHLIAQAEFRPQRFSEVFRLSLMYGSRETIRLKLRAVLTRGLSESLDQHSGPFVHLGGAGLHYERRDRNGILVPKPSNYRRMGPFKKPNRPKWPESPLAEDIEGRINKEFQVWDVIPGFEGEWFDAYDVAGYLKERGVHLEDGKAIKSFIEAELVDDDILATQEAVQGATVAAANEQALVQQTTFGVHDAMQVPVSSSFAMPMDTLAMQKPADSTIAFANPYNEAAATSIQQTDFNPSIFGFDVSRNSNDGMTSWMQAAGMSSTMDLSPSILTTATISSTASGLATPSTYAPMPQQAPVPKKPISVTIDVAKLIDQLISNAKCLGRTPGYRRKDVDTALKQATLQNFIY